MRVAIDTEGDDLHPFLTKLYCCCAVDIDTGESKTYLNRIDLIKAAKEWTTVIAHNLVGYDLWALRKCWDVQFTVGPDEFHHNKVEFVDTLVWSRTLWPDRPWGHSLEDWGNHLGMPKYAHQDFTGYSDAMRTYCIRDAEICAAVYKYLLEEKAR